MVIHSITYSEFDNDIGPIMIHQYPNKILDHKQFFSIYKYIIAVPELCGNILTTKYGEYYVISYPVYIYKFRKYARNVFHFSLSIVLTGDDFDRYIDAYKDILVKVTEYLTQCENDESYISSDHKRENILNIISKIYNDINSIGMCKLMICDKDIVLKRNDQNKKCILF